MAAATANRTTDPSPVDTVVRLAAVDAKVNTGGGHSRAAAALVAQVVPVPLHGYTQLDATSFDDGAWYGKYVRIVPQY